MRGQKIDHVSVFYHRCALSGRSQTSHSTMEVERTTRSGGTINEPEKTRSQAREAKHQSSHLSEGKNSMDLVALKSFDGKGSEATRNGECFVPHITVWGSCFSLCASRSVRVRPLPASARHPHIPHHVPLILHNSSYTTYHIRSFLHSSSYTTHHIPSFSHNSSAQLTHTTHHIPLVSHNSSHTTHLTQLILDNSSHITHQKLLISHHSSSTT